MINALTIDVEDYFQVSAFDAHISRTEWDQMPCRVERNVELILSLLHEKGAKATFFTLGWIAERYPALIRRMVDEGHELASHGYAHHRALTQSPEAFRADVKLARQILEDVSGKIVQGYRAPSFSIGRTNPWAFDCLREAGYRYSSSVYPVRHDHYGMPEAPRFPFESRPGLLEIPVTTCRILQANLPAGGGGYFRLLPYSVTKWMIHRVNRVDRKPAVFYFHPWEVDPEQPRVNGTSRKTRFRHYVNLHRTRPRLRQLLADFRWDRADRVFLSSS
jgi:polysaccharide deacetylase family protein (PEP-CTERM system associated)